VKSSEHTTSLAIVLGDEDRLSRFLFDRGDFSREKNKVKPGAFERRPGDADLSTFRTEGMDEVVTWTLGSSTRPERELKARADLTPSVVRRAGLDVDPDDNPRGHVGIVGWPNDDADKLEARKQLANNSELKIKPEAVPAVVSARPDDGPQPADAGTA
jgi:hypothetical protein